MTTIDINHSSKKGIDFSKSICFITLCVLSFFCGMTLIVENKGLLHIRNLQDNKVLSPQQPQREPRLGDDCLLVYLDVGSNIGVHNRFLFQPNLYPYANNIIKEFDQTFGIGRDNRDICAFGFEPNPAHKVRHQQLEIAYQKMGWRYKYIQAGVGDHDGNLTFWHENSQADNNHNEWGFRMYQQNENSTSVTVPLINLPQWIQHHIVERQLPKQIYGNYSSVSTTQQQQTIQEGKVMMKMDIEGSEYLLLPWLLMSGVFCRGIDFMFGEFHAWMAHGIKRDMIKHPEQQGYLDLNEKSALEWDQILMQQVLKSILPENCKGTWLYLDSEAYVHDGKPFPKPNGTSI